jgi:hypothetical protein
MKEVLLIIRMIFLLGVIIRQKHKKGKAKQTNFGGKDAWLFGHQREFCNTLRIFFSYQHIFNVSRLSPKQ